MSQYSSVSDTNFELKHRLVGALILIVFAIVVFPMILEAPKPEAEDEHALTEADDNDNKVFISKIIPISGATPERRRDAGKTQVPDAVGARDRGTVSPPLSADDAAAATASPRAVQRNRAAAPTPRGDAEGGKPPSAPAAPASAPVSGAHTEVIERGWIVRIGTFSIPENADRILRTLRDNGFAATAEGVNTGRGPATRVWVGPFAQRVDAGRARSRIYQTVGEKGLITAYP